MASGDIAGLWARCSDSA